MDLFTYQLNVPEYYGCHIYQYRNLRYLASSTVQRKKWMNVFKSPFLQMRLVEAFRYSNVHRGNCQSHELHRFITHFDFILVYHVSFKTIPNVLDRVGLWICAFTDLVSAMVFDIRRMLRHTHQGMNCLIFIFVLGYHREFHVEVVLCLQYHFTCIIHSKV